MFGDMREKGVRVSLCPEESKAMNMQVDVPGNVCVVGLQWGDEGKGKIVNLLTDPAGPGGGFDFVVRYGGGANAGHTVVVGENTFAMHLVPSGILWPEVTAVVANGVVVDPEVLQRIEDIIATSTPAPKPPPAPVPVPVRHQRLILLHD